MITKIEIENINAIKHTEIDFEKSRYQFLNENIFNEKYVNPIAIYGYNASGKSSFINALENLVSILWKEPGAYMPFLPNFLNGSDSNSKIKIWFTLSSKNYLYFMETNLDDGIMSEELDLDGKKIFYKIDNINYSYNGKKGSLDSPSFSLLRKLANDNNDVDICDAYEFLSNISYIDESKELFTCKQLYQKSINDLIVEKSTEVKEILKRYKQFPIYSVDSKINEEGKKYYYFTLNVNNIEKKLPAILMSTGMYNQSILLSIFAALPKNSVIVIDEIEDALHPVTIMDFINVVKEKNIQLIFTSHNTNILQRLRPDQIIFANWKNGFSSYKKLSDIYPSIREVNNIEKMYLSNLFDKEIEGNE